MKKKIMKKITKIATVVTASAMVMGTCIACGNNANVENAEPTNSEAEVVEATEATELVTYEFETYDNLKIVIDENSIITQEPSDDPQNSELIPAEAASNVIAPGRDYVYFADDNNYYVADLYNNLVTVADKSKVQSEVIETAETEEVENPGAFDTDSWSISYDTEKWYGFEDNGSVVINNLNAVAGSSYIEITEADVATVDEAVAMLQDAKGKKLTTPEKAEVSGTECYVVYDEPTDSDGEGVAIFDFYLIFENNGKVIIINESITQDSDESRAEALSYEFDDVVHTFVLK